MTPPIDSNQQPLHEAADLIGRYDSRQTLFLRLVVLFTIGFSFREQIDSALNSIPPRYDFFQTALTFIVILVPLIFLAAATYYEEKVKELRKTLPAQISKYADNFQHNSLILFLLIVTLFIPQGWNIVAIIIVATVNEFINRRKRKKLLNISKYITENNR